MDQTDQTAINADVLGTLSNSMADAVERVGPSLVLVNGRQRQPASGVVYAEDMVLTAANQALGQAKEISNTEMGKITSGLSLPGLG